MTPEAIQQLLESPSETLGVELKEWLNPSLDADKAKIVKACLALRNYGGGVLLVGFTDDGIPCKVPSGLDVRAEYHPDKIQQLVAKYASKPFEVAVSIETRGDIAYPLIRVPPGVTTPVACCSDLAGHLKCHAVYCRTLRSNNRVSSSEATHKDWDELVKTCFDNREADIGSFFRRHMTDAGIRRLIAAITELSPEGHAVRSAQPTALDFGWSRYEQVLKERQYQVPDIGYFEVAVSPSVERSELIRPSDIHRLDAGRPRYSGWSPWIVLMHAPDSGLHPYSVENAWECIAYGGVLGMHIDFWRISENGHLYALRGLEDDLNGKVDPKTAFDPFIQCMRVSEYLISILEISKLLLPSTSNEIAVVSMRWKGLLNRSLLPWADHSRFLRHSGTCRVDSIATQTTLSLDTQHSALAPHVEELLQPVLQLFGALEFEPETYEAFVQKVLSWRH